ncbi:MAG TPA: hypothetical protein VI076_01610, partial [Actinopolymorphaceae bacterium]
MSTTTQPTAGRPTHDHPATPEPPTTGEPTGRSSRTEPSPGQPNTGRSRSRDPFFDNAKFLAIVLVVVGHAIEPLRDIAAVHAVYLFLYMFHMPV